MDLTSPTFSSIQKTQLYQCEGNMSQIGLFDESFDGFFKSIKPVEPVTEPVVYKDPNQLELSLGNFARQGDLN